MDTRCPNCGKFKLSSFNHYLPMIYIWVILGMLFGYSGLYFLFFIFSFLIPIYILVKIYLSKRVKVQCKYCRYVGYIDKNQ